MPPIRSWKLSVSLAFALILGVSGWIGWEWYSRPVPPDIPLSGVDEEVKEAIREALAAVRREPRSADAWGKLSLVLVANGFGEQAISCLALADRLDPHDPRWPCLRGVLLVRSNPSEAIPLLRRGLPLTQTPGDRGAILFGLAGALIEEQAVEEAEKCLEELRMLERDTPRVQFGFGLLASAKGNVAGAHEQLAPLAENPFTRKQVCLLLGRLPGENSEAVRAYQDRATRLPPDLPWPRAFEDDLRLYDVERMRWITRYTDLNSHGHYAEAASLLREFLQKTPYSEGCFLLGSTLSEMDETDEASEVFRAVIAFNPQNVKAHSFLASALLRSGEKRWENPDGKERAKELFRQALTAADGALALQSSHPLGHLLRGKALKHLGRTDEALRAFHEGLLCQPDSADMHLALGETLAEVGRQKEAMSYLEDAKKLALPGDPRPQEALERWRARGKPLSDKREEGRAGSSP